MNEIEYLASDTVEISGDVYQMTIAVNMTKNASPVQIAFAIK